MHEFYFTGSCTGSPRSYELLRSWREFVKRVAISHKRNVIIGGYVPERPTDGQKKLEIVLFPEKKHASNGNMSDYHTVL
jgi:hypothetical protein